MTGARCDVVPDKARQRGIQRLVALYRLGAAIERESGVVRSWLTLSRDGAISGVARGEPRAITVDGVPVATPF